ncbi:MAG: hypothetical protein AAGA75_20990 [Cyanobacteria bacterium P01_E01_bin.6]
MTEQNTSSSQEIAPDPSFDADVIAPGFNTVLQINQAVRRLLVDYALAAAILGLIPLHGNKWVEALGLLALGLLNLKLIREIGKCWGYPKGQDMFALVSSLLSVFGAFAIAIMARIILSTMSFFIPLAIVISAPMGHAILTWALGRATHQFYLSTRQIDPDTLKQVLQHQQPHRP